MAEITNTRVDWYRTPLDKSVLANLNKRSDFKGFLQSLGHLGLLTLTGGAAIYGVGQWPFGPGRWPWYVVLAILFLHGTMFAFMINAVHELVHGAVFKTKFWNEFFVRVFGFLGWIGFEMFYTSHKRHHQYTLHAPDDLEVTLPIKVLTKHFFQWGFLNPLGIRFVVQNTWRVAHGRFQGEWEQFLFPESEPERRKRVMNWAWFILAGHATIIIVSLCFKLWMVPVVTSFAPFYGSWLFFLCNNTQHIGLQDDVPDFRLCCRTFTVNPFVQFLYWHMNYHIEHHMYAAVPCYNLGKLHRAIKHDLPPCPSGIAACWQEIAAIQRKQVEDPTFKHVAAVPSHEDPDIGHEAHSMGYEALA